VAGDIAQGASCAVDEHGQWPLWAGKCSHRTLPDASPGVRHCGEKPNNAILDCNVTYLLGPDGTAGWAFRPAVASGGRPRWAHGVRGRPRDQFNACPAATPAASDRFDEIRERLLIGDLRYPRQVHMPVLPHPDCANHVEPGEVPALCAAPASCFIGSGQPGHGQTIAAASAGLPCKCALPG
jgi:hypothetical protein